MARDDWLSRSPRRGGSRWERWSGRERGRGAEDIERGYGAMYREEWEPEEAEIGPARARRARERWGADWWGGGYGGYQEGYGASRAMRRGAGWGREFGRGTRYRGGEEETTYGSPYYDRLPFRSRRRGEGGEAGYGWEFEERRYFRPYDREYQAGYGEPYRRAPGYTGEYTWGGRPGYRAYRGWRGGQRGMGRRWREQERRYGRDYGW